MKNLRFFFVGFLVVECKVCLKSRLLFLIPIYWINLLLLSCFPVLPSLFFPLSLSRPLFCSQRLRLTPFCPPVLSFINSPFRSPLRIEPGQIEEGYRGSSSSSRAGYRLQSTHSWAEKSRKKRRCGRERSALRGERDVQWGRKISSGVCKRLLSSSEW